MQRRLEWKNWGKTVMMCWEKRAQAAQTVRVQSVTLGFVFVFNYVQEHRIPAIQQCPMVSKSF